jgi:hypothetical protein
MSFGLNMRFAPIVLLLAGCGAAPESDPALEEVGEDSEAIVRGTTDDGHAAVMALDIFNDDGSETLCTGALYAKKVVVTAAHCLERAVLVLVYNGNDFFVDFDELGNDPETWVHWRWSEQFEMHPKYDPATLNADIGVVYLDRQLPIKPLPLAIRDVGRHHIGDRVEIVGYGAAGLDDNGFPVDAYVKRKGRTYYQGLPRIKPLPVNPHPGLLIPKIRAQLMQLEGSAPKANGCFGDSGGPALMTFHGRQHIVGISSWGDDFCNDFSYYVRVHDFLPFLGKAVLKSR